MSAEDLVRGLALTLRLSDGREDSSSQGKLPSAASGGRPGDVMGGTESGWR